MLPCSDPLHLHLLLLLRLLLLLLLHLLRVDSEADLESTQPLTSFGGVLEEGLHPVPAPLGVADVVPEAGLDAIAPRAPLGERPG